MEALNRQAGVAGRIMRKRGPFIVIQDVSGQIQLYVDKKGLPAETLEEIKGWDIGDIVAARGPVHKSGKGDLYVMMVEAKLLTKSLRPLPDKFHGLTDMEARYRQRYVDLIMNADDHPPGFAPRRDGPFPEGRRPRPCVAAGPSFPGEAAALRP